jgi:hypothetical protein
MTPQQVLDTVAPDGRTVRQMVENLGRGKAQIQLATAIRMHPATNLGPIGAALVRAARRV